MPKITQLVSVQDSNLILFDCKAQALLPVVQLLATDPHAYSRAQERV